MFYDRHDAGERLCEALQKYKGSKDTVVLGIPRGGVIPAQLIAEEFKLPLDVVLVKKIGHPDNKEYAIGAVCLSNYYLDADIKLPDNYLQEEVKRLQDVLWQRYESYYGKSQPTNIQGKDVILVDDGVATGSTIIAAIKLLRKSEPRKIVVAIPVGPPSTVNYLERIADEVICLEIPASFGSIGRFYFDFEAVTDAEVLEILRLHHDPKRHIA